MVNSPVEPGSVEWAGEVLLSHPWKFAKSMPSIPHEYTLREQWSNQGNFEKIVRLIRERGNTEFFFKKPFVYLRIGEYKYWSMGAPVEETILINRAKVE